jgi:hypothetical protein
VIRVLDPIGNTTHIQALGEPLCAIGICYINYPEGARLLRTHLLDRIYKIDRIIASSQRFQEMDAGRTVLLDIITREESVIENY